MNPAPHEPAVGARCRAIRTRDEQSQECGGAVRRVTTAEHLARRRGLSLRREDDHAPLARAGPCLIRRVPPVASAGVYDDVDYLFAQGDLRASLQGHGEGITQEIESAPEDHVLKADEISWAQALAERYAIQAPTLNADEVWMDEPAATPVDVSWDHFNRLIRDPSRPAMVAGHRTVVHIPFSGDKNVFQLRPSSYSLNPPRAVVGDLELLLPLEYPDDRPLDITGQTIQLIKAVQGNLETARADIAYFNSGLLNEAQLAIRSRKQRIERHREHVARTGMRVGPPRDMSKAYIADVIVRRPAPALRASNTERPLPLEPVLADEVYEHILSVIHQHAVSMEQNPQTYAGMGEEGRRHVILDALNTHYSGAGTAEGFNFGGKTDILIRHEGRNLFIAECKFWSGQKGFTETLDQLFGYQAWRDTKLAVLMFVRERGLTSIIERARTALEAHPQFVAWGTPASETELRATVSWLGDDRRTAALSVCFISTPVE